MSNNHNKKRNVGLIYEFIVRYITSSIVNEQDEKASRALKILKKHYKEGSEIHKEFRLFNSLLRTTVSSESVATTIISEAKSFSRKIERNKLDIEKSLLIKELNHTLNEPNFYNQRIDGYKTYATIQTLFNTWRATGQINLMELARYEDFLVTWLTSKKELPIHETNLETDNLIVKIMTEKLNEKYSQVLSDEQTRIIQEYVFSIENNNNEKILEILSTIKDETLCAINGELENIPSDETIVEKLKNVRDKILSESLSEISDTTIARYLEVVQLKQELLEKTP